MACLRPDVVQDNEWAARNDAVNGELVVRTRQGIRLNSQAGSCVCGAIAERSARGTTRSIQCLSAATPRGRSDSPSAPGWQAAHHYALIATELTLDEHEPESTDYGPR